MSKVKYFCKQEHDGECCLSPLAPVVCAPIESIAEQIQSLKAKLKKCKEGLRWIEDYLSDLPYTSVTINVYEKAKALSREVEGE